MPSRAGLVQEPKDSKMVVPECVELFTYNMFVLAAYSTFFLSGLMLYICGCTQFCKSSNGCSCCSTATLTFITPILFMLMGT